MNRRGFLGAAAAAVAALAIDPERLLWVPGAKTIFIPPAVSSSADIYRLWLLSWDEKVAKGLFYGNVRNVRHEFRGLHLRYEL